jgi:FkbM family methyltransferase
MSATGSSVKRAWFRLLSSAENRLARWQGKGSGAGTAEKEARMVAALLDRDSVKLCIDVGGNKGRYAQAAADLFPRATIHVFEPALVNIQTMTEKFANVPRVVLHQVALSDKAGNATLYTNTPGSGLASLAQRRLEHYGFALNIEEQVQTLRFDEFWTQGLGRAPIDLVKMDIEGHELAALEGFGDAIKHVHVLQFEFGGCNLDTRTYFRDFWYFFRKRGFRLYRLTPFGLLEIPRYEETLEAFTTTNYVAVSKRFLKERGAKTGL